jgi:seryl-tRNA synthetase
MEQYQNKDGSVGVPDVLRPYVDGKTTLEPL